MYSIRIARYMYNCTQHTHTPIKQYFEFLDLALEMRTLIYDTRCKQSRMANENLCLRFVRFVWCVLFFFLMFLLLPCEMANLSMLKKIGKQMQSSASNYKYLEKISN